MIIQKTKCEDCVKKDVCSITGQFLYAFDSISSANTTNEDRSFYEARNNKNIEVIVSCLKFMKVQPQIR